MTPELPDVLDTATQHVTVGVDQGCDHLTQQVVRFAPGRSRQRGFEGERVEEVLYVQDGRGTLELGSNVYPLHPDTAVHIAPGESYSIHNAGPKDLVLVAVAVPASRLETGELGPRQVTMRLSDQEVHATGNRRFRITTSPASGCRSVTQFVGEIPPGAAPPHSHTYDEIVYVLSGEGICHVDGHSEPVAAGTAVYLPPKTVHCMENPGQDILRVLGVFHPAGDPSSKTVQPTERSAS